MYVFREGRRSVSSAGLRRALIESLSGLACSANRDSIQSLALESLLRAGELECALADYDEAQQELTAQITNGLAAQLVSEKPANTKTVCDLLERLRLPPELTVSAPEGFAYYALHPLQYARLVETLTLGAPLVAVVGIRSIGTTLSAVVQAALQKRGLRAERITVRPEGHPFDRITRFSSRQRDWVPRHQAAAAQFLVVDEGPGLSGSSLLSTAEALVAAGASPERVILLCAHQPNPAALCARDAAERCKRFSWYAVPPSTALPEDAGAFVGAGRWRTALADGDGEWPASWTSLERSKFLSRDGKRLYKFEGLGQYGSAVHVRACVLHEAGFSPEIATRPSATGYVGYGLTPGQNLRNVVLTQQVIEGIARYCAFRVSAFAYTDVRQCESNRQNLHLMLHTNFIEEFGSAPDVSYQLEVEKPVIADGRMQPWEWAIARDNLIKFDAVSHGDDHFFPGPTDIAWDLAGAVVEFSLHAGSDMLIADQLLETYQKYSGDDASHRMPGYLLAYTAFRLGYCKMAADAMRGSEEEPRLRREHLLYRGYAARLLARRVAA